MNNLPGLQVTAADLALLQAEWHALLKPYQASDEQARYWFDSVAAEYSAPGRVYHNLHHIAELLRLVAEFQSRLQAYQIVGWAVWLHDVIYDTTKPDNEAQSAAYAARLLASLNAPAATIAAVQSLILATNEHQGAALSPEAAVFLDTDLAILGAATELYQQYSQAIREEYEWVPEALYRQERRQVLQKFLQRERIYRTPELYARFEAQARQNLASEIHWLS